MNRYIPAKIIKKLYAKSGNHCAFPGCQEKLYVDNANISEICHIQGVNPNSARYNPDLSQKEVNAYDNLILLCPHHHELIDQCPEVYTVENLNSMKIQHEEYISQLLSKNDNRYKNFYYELQKIFQQNLFDEIFFEQDFEVPFSVSFFDLIDKASFEIRKVLNTKEALCLPVDEQQELLAFIRLLDYTFQAIAINTYYNDGYAIPKYNESDSEAIKKNFEKLREIYKKYRFKRI